MDRGPQFPYKYVRTVGGLGGAHPMLEVHHKDDGKVGHILWDSDTGVIQNVTVDPAHRRKGLATSLLRQAEAERGEPLKHNELRSQNGDAWARAVGGDLPNPDTWDLFNGNIKEKSPQQ